MNLLGYFNDTITPTNDITLPIHDLLIFRGLGVFDYMRTYNRIPFLLDDHLQRLLTSAKVIGINHNETYETLKKKVLHLSDVSPLPESAFRLILTSGMGKSSLEPGIGQLVILTEEVHPYPDENYLLGVKAKIIHYDRYEPISKSITYSAAVVELSKAKSEGFQEVIYSNAGRITEGTTCNFYAVIANKLVTIDKDIVFGTRRKYILSFANDILPIELREINLTELGNIQEAFVSSTTREVMPIIQLNQQTIGSGKPGHFTLQLMKRYREGLPKISTQIK